MKYPVQKGTRLILAHPPCHHVYPFHQILSVGVRTSNANSKTNTNNTNITTSNDNNNDNTEQPPTQLTLQLDW